jgi:FkbM family methyltransferase
MFKQSSRHHFLQKLFWNPLLSPFVPVLVRYERMFDVVVRNYSLIGETNGERWLLSLMENEPTVFDVGFHDGGSTKEILRVRPKAHVIAFDPSKFALESYYKHFANDERLAFENIGLSNTAGKLEFHDYANMCNSLVVRKEISGADKSSYEVSITTIDAYCLRKGIDRINFLKIDAEGFDLQVLEGAHELLSRQAIDIFIFEFASGWASSKRYLWEAVEYFQPLPYTLYRLFNGFLCPLLYDVKLDSCCTLSTMYVGVSSRRSSRGDISIRDYNF